MIDSHLHLWTLDTFVTGGERPYPWLGPQHGALYRSFGEDEALETLKAAGVRGAVLVQADDTVADTDSMLAVAKRNPWVLGVVGWVRLDSPDECASQLDSFTAQPVFKGVRHLVHDDPRADFLDLPAVRESLALVAQRGLAFDVPDAFPRHLGSTVRLARELPELTVVLDHLGKPPRSDASLMDSWRTDFLALGRQPNTVAKLSGLHASGLPYTSEALRRLFDTALDAFGAERLMIGGDWPVSTLGAPYGRTLDVLLELVSALSPSEQDLILEGTAIRTYGLAANPLVDA
ncbi:amidohydrolase family protein [Paenarthrobacter histidinolovorans]|uniref:amidohydrolase family protein n=1 Tax=Paenarthrobacter histidinolovorans TaxID=43664 RepID=UPI00166C85F2|nr:amidohydrolase family protein [Paenarthrobacter histidinolovorans]GGJ37284.1 metal-dependent hydrolase [Paenarthrobacter histidinolovorans]